MTQLPGDGSCTTQQQQPDISATAPPGGVKKRKLSSSSDSVNESTTPQKVIEIKSEFRHGWITRDSPFVTMTLKRCFVVFFTVANDRLF